ncbi:conserved hypothetical protein [Ricinus communis]|uniref:Uncharacterized protein n=1 Tax=Ricinus communis TaxID=3988 RepID=B9RZU1_RICCO|nr:conserved hypothetical protein [Ricinus communis]
MGFSIHSQALSQDRWEEMTVLKRHSHCERHMNESRHRRRKHMEGQSGLSATKTTDAEPMLTASIFTYILQIL